MSKPKSEIMRLRSDFRKYLVKIATNKVTHELTENDILKAFDLAVQKQELTTLENEYLNEKSSVEKSKIDFSRELDLQAYNMLKEALYQIAAYSEGDLVTTTFDEPAAARLARKVLTEVANI